MTLWSLPSRVINHLPLLCKGLYNSKKRMITLYRLNHTNSEILNQNVVYRYWLWWIICWLLYRPVIVHSADIYNSADCWLFCISQGNVSCIVMDWWITSMCVRIEPVAPAGTKRQHSSVAHLWVQVHQQLCFFFHSRFAQNESTCLFARSIGCFCENHSIWRTQVFVEWATTNAVSVYTVFEKMLRIHA